MPTEDVLLRIDRTLDRIDARLEQGERRSEEERRRWWEERRRSEEEWRKRDAEMRAFMDGFTRRHVAVTQEMIGTLGQLQREIADQREEIRANTKAILSLLDERFGPERPQG